MIVAMTTTPVRLGHEVGPFPGRLDAELVRRYAAATRDPSAAAQRGEVVPAVASVTQIWDAQEAARAELVDASLQASSFGGVHGSHELLLHRPLVVGEPLNTWVDAWGARPAGQHAAVTLRYTTRDAADAVVVEQWWTTVYLGVGCDEVGRRAPDLGFPDEARDRVVGRAATTIDDGMPRRYAEVSGDWSAHHFDPAAARRSGYDRPFLHGLCTMALCAQATVSAMRLTHDRVRRIAVRFASPAFVGSEVSIRLYDAGPARFGLEAESDGRLTISRGIVAVA
jgi:acyl dehydratase